MKASKADPFKVWGQPPAPLSKLPKKHLATLRRYIEAITGRAYTTGYDNGFVEGLTKVSMVAAVELRKQRDRMFRGVQRR